MSSTAMSTPSAGQIATAGTGQLAAASSGSGIVDADMVIAQARAVQKVKKALMKEGVHYGKIPGTPKDSPPSLYKPGSEVLLSAFRISVEPEVREVTRDGNHITYQIACIGRYIPTGAIIGIGVGEASTAEDKYGWRKVVCDAEYNDTPEDKRRTKWMKGFQGEAPYQVKQVRTNPADIANTVLKMGKKRAQIDLCLTALAASDCFTQDLEDLPEGILDADGKPEPAKPRQRFQERPKSGQPQSSGGGDGMASTPQINMIKAKLRDAKKEEADLLSQYGIALLEQLPKGKVNDALDWIAGKGAYADAGK